jgi:hypothetical protein
MKSGSLMAFTVIAIPLPLPRGEELCQTFKYIVGIALNVENFEGNENIKSTFLIL